MSRLSAAALLAVPAIGIGGLMAYVRSPYVTNQQMPVEQPIEFDHRHHAGDEKIDCQYCHWTVDKSPSAGIPSTTVCMSCHAQVWNKSPYLTEVRKAFFSDMPIQWVRVHNLPDFVYFNHAIHVNKGVGCASCHGRIDQMGAVEQFAPLTMAWCLECHRNPEPHLRPPEFITSMTWTPPKDKTEAAALGKKLRAEYEVHSRTSCSTCHR